MQKTSTTAKSKANTVKAPAAKGAKMQKEHTMQTEVVETASPTMNASEAAATVAGASVRQGGRVKGQTDEEKAAKQAERDKAKAEAKAAKDAEREAKKAEREAKKALSSETDAEKLAAKEAKKAEREAAKAAKLAEREQRKVERQAKLEAAKAEREAAKAYEKAPEGTLLREVQDADRARQIEALAKIGREVKIPDLGQFILDIAALANNKYGVGESQDDVVHASLSKRQPKAD